MLARVRTSSIATRAGAVAAVIATLAGCGSGSSNSARDARRTATLGANATASTTPEACATTVMSTLVRIAMRVYHEGVSSERTGSAFHTINASLPLREAVARGDAPAARAAARALIAGGHLTNLRILRGGQVLIDVGSGGAVAPLHGTLKGAGGQAIASYDTSVWSDEGLIAETDGVAQSSTVLRAQGRTVGGSFALPPGQLPAQGTLTIKGVRYLYTSFAAERFPAGKLRVYLVKAFATTQRFCGVTEQDTVYNTLTRVAHLIYEGEAGGRTLPQVRRVQGDPALLGAVAKRDPAATRRAVETLLNQHIVRLRVRGGGRLLADVGGPFVLAPVRASLHLGTRRIGDFVLSIQDDEGYLRLTHRLAGLDVLMYMGPALVKNSLGPAPGTVPDSGLYHYRGNSFRVYSFDARAFPSGPLHIKVLIPIPYS